MGLASQVTDFVDNSKDFAVDSVRFLNKCTKPDKKGNDFNLEFYKIASSCALGFVIMGVIGYAIKLVFIPINNIILN